MEGLVNYSSEEEREESPKRNVAERCPALAIDPYKRSKGDSSRRSKEENVRGSANERSQCSSHREKDAHTNFRKNTHEESNWNRFNSSSRDNYYRSDRRQTKSYDKRRDTKDDRKRRDGHRDREYEHRDGDRDRRDRFDRYRRDNRHDRERRRKSSESPPPSNKDRNAANNRSRNRSRSRSSSKEYPSHSKTTVITHTAETMFTDTKQPKIEQKIVTPISLLPQSKITHNLQTFVSLPVKEEAPKMLNTNNTSESVGIALPTYYNPNIINPTKYAEQVQKRKLIWGSKKSEDTASKWGHATFSEDSDGKVASKFMRLMGIKSTPKPGASSATDTSSGEKTGPDVKSRQAMFSNMEQQYEVARQVTHTMRGVGLGFGSQSRQY